MFVCLSLSCLCLGMRGFSPFPPQCSHASLLTTLPVTVPLLPVCPRHFREGEGVSLLPSPVVPHLLWLAVKTWPFPPLPYVLWQEGREGSWWFCVADMSLWPLATWLSPPLCPLTGREREGMMILCACHIFMASCHLALPSPLPFHWKGRGCMVVLCVWHISVYERRDALGSVLLPLLTPEGTIVSLPWSLTVPPPPSLKMEVMFHSYNVLELQKFIASAALPFSPVGTVFHCSTSRRCGVTSHSHDSQVWHFVGVAICSFSHPALPP